MRVSLRGVEVRVPHDLLQEKDVSVPAQIARCGVMSSHGLTTYVPPVADHDCAGSQEAVAGVGERIADDEDMDRRFEQSQRVCMCGVPQGHARQARFRSARK